MNGYFQLVFNDMGTSLCIYPPTDGGAILDVNEVTNYLQKRKVNFDITAVNVAIRNAKEKTVIHLSNQKMNLEEEMFDLKVTADTMQAIARFYPPSLGTGAKGKTEIINELKQQKIIFGIDEEAIDRFIGNREYCTDIIVAKGKMPRQGKDAAIEYYFNTNLKVRPTLKEDGSVDFFNLNTINHCKKDDILARLYKEDIGENGIGVLGNIIRPRDVKRCTLQYGKHITLSEERTVLTSQVNGHVCLVDNMVFVSNVYQVENVDNATGNIEYEGSVLVNANVCSNFSVIAHGDVEVRGLVEGAFIQADGNIVIARGMNGMSRGKLKAGGNVVAKFIENATVEAGGYVETEAILHSTVMARSEVNVLSHKGFITGGKVVATNAINVKNLGSPMGADTVVEIGLDPTMKEKYNELQKELVLIHKTLQQIEPIITAARQKLARGETLAPDRLKYVQTLTIANKQKNERLQKCEIEIQELQELLKSNQNANITVSGEVYSGTKIVISDAALTVKDTVKYCRFIRSQGEVKMTAL